MRLLTFIMLLAISINACKPSNSSNTIELNPKTHSFSNLEKVRTTHLSWDVKVNFDLKQISGQATWKFQNPTDEKYIHFDTYDLTIKKVTVNGKETQYFLTPMLKDYGSGLSIPIKDKDSVVMIEYNTGALATALQWLAPEQTAGKVMPYLFTQCESIHARSLLPCQDAPLNRITYDAKVQVPKGMMALMSAKNPTEKNVQGIYNFEMEIPIPTYLIALAVGDIAYKPIDLRSGVYTEPVMLDIAANELSDIPNMMKAAEALGGKYRWGKYDVLIAPPSFPIGGMENPRLTFATPTIIAGDKSLVALIAHEMAHSWSGNLVTNSNWNDLWLNEGFTTYFERRIMEKITDKTYTDMLWELGYQDMQSDLVNLGQTNPDTRLKVDLIGREPGAAFSNIPYEKGAVFLRMLEENIGREKFDLFINNYFSSNAFTPMTTEKCLEFMDKNLFGGDTNFRNKLLVKDWIYQPGLPSNCPHILPNRFMQVDTQRVQFEGNGSAIGLQTKTWSTHEWLQFLRKIKHPLPLPKMEDLDRVFNLTNTSNSEIADEWYRLAISSNYERAFPNMELFLGKVGRKKFLEPLYMEMMLTEKGKVMARNIFEKSKRNYHPLTAQKIAEIINSK